MATHPVTGCVAIGRRDAGNYHHADSEKILLLHIRGSVSVLVTGFLVDP